MQNNLKEIREKFGISQEKLAHKVDVTLGTIQNIENKNYECSINTAIKIMKVLECKNIEDIFISD